MAINEASMLAQLPPEQLDIIIMDPNAPPSAKAQAAREKERRSGGGMQGPQMRGKSTYDEYLAPAVGGLKQLFGSAMEQYDSMAGSRADPAARAAAAARQQQPDTPGIMAANAAEPVGAPPIPQMMPMAPQGGPTAQDLQPPPQDLAQAAMAAGQPKDETQASIQAGAQAAQAQVAPPPSPGVSGINPDATGGTDWNQQFLDIVRAYSQEAEDTGPSREDKMLALAQAGFGMAASKSPHLGVAFGEGGLQGVQALRQLQAQRAEQSMKRASMGLDIAGRTASLGMQGEQLGLQRQAQARADAAQAAEETKYAEAAPERAARLKLLEAQTVSALRGANEAVPARIQEAQSIQKALAARNPPVIIDMAEALQRTYREGSNDMTDAQALNIVTKAEEAAQASDKSVDDILKDWSTKAKALKGGKTESKSTGGVSTETGTGTEKVVVAKTQADIDNAPSGTILEVDGKRFRKP